MNASHARWYHLLGLMLTGFLIVGCEGSDGAAGPAGPAGATGPTGPPGPAGPPATAPVTIGDGSALTADEIAALGKLTATITGVTVSSPPVVDFTVTDANGNPAEGIESGYVWFTFAKLVPNTDPAINGGLPFWQSYVNRVENVANNQPGRGSDVLTQAVQATTDSRFSGGSHVEVAPGQYEYTFGTDVTNVTAPIAVPWEPNLTHRVGLEIRLDGEGEVPLAPDNPVFDFVPDGGAGSGVTRNILETDKCEGCHYEFAFHGGPRKTMEYCVTCHNQGTVDQDSGNSLDFAYMLHSVHMGDDRAGAVPFKIWGFSDFEHDYSQLHYPQSKTFCETCHTATAAAPDGDNWTTVAAAKPCIGCHADGEVLTNVDAVTGQADFRFDHNAAGADSPIGTTNDGQCGSCHLGSISSAGPALAIHSSIAGDQRARKAAGENFVFDFLAPSAVGPGQTPVATFRVADAAGNPYDILNDPEFDAANGASLNLYVQWATADYYGGDENGQVLGGRQNDNLSTQAIQALDFRDTGYPFRMRLGAIKNAAAPNATFPGSYDVTLYRALPTAYTGDVVIGLGGHPAWQTTDADGNLYWERAAAVSALYFPGEARVAAHDSAKCNACHNQLQMHGTNRNGNAEFCLMCHNGDAAVCQSNPDASGACPAGNTNEGYHFGYMVHSIHIGSTTFQTDGGGDFSEVHFPQNVANCDTCHKPGLYNVARATARAVSTDQGSDIRVWTDDIASTATAAVCGVCHTSTAAKGHFESQGGQVDDLKCTIVGAECTVPDGSAGTGLPNGQEACAVCHGAGSEFDTTKYHNPGVE